MLANRYVYLHGFASSPLSLKGMRMAEAFADIGVTLHRVDLNRPSFEKITYTAALGALDEIDARVEGGPLRLIGSSMGGYLAARWAELHPEKVDRLMLMCPGFDLARRWPVLVGPQRLKGWEEEGTLPLPDVHGEFRPVHWEFIEDARKRHPAFPEVSCETLIVHGRGDETVLIETSRDYARGREHVRLIEVDDDHGLVASLEDIVAWTMDFFDLEAGDSEVKTK
ncbi:MAG: YqiA/YcfP family alpha/beta fold hydrolase [Bradymonadaceae bacterium]